MAEHARSGGPVGNVYDKYGTKNPIARKLMQGFLSTVQGMYVASAPRRVLEVGCGEGELATRLMRVHAPECFVACDLALPLAPDIDPRIHFQQASIYALPHADRSFDLVVCCEVLEHLDDPQRGLSELARVSSRALIVSTPREPVWRALNLARGKYLSDLGNTPGHVQHFGRRELARTVATYFDLVDVQTPLPWTVIRARARSL